MEGVLWCGLSVPRAIVIGGFSCRLMLLGGDGASGRWSYREVLRLLGNEAGLHGRLLRKKQVWPRMSSFSLFRFQI
jgi:hypothetical protein